MTHRSAPGRVLAGLVLACLGFSWLSTRSVADELRPIASWPGSLRGIPRDAVVRSGKAYLAMDSGGLTVFDFADPDHPRRLGEIHLPGRYAPRRVVVEGSRAVTLDSDGTLSGIDLTDPAHPSRVSAILRRPWSQTLDLREGVALCHTWDAERQQASLEAWDLFREGGPERLAVVDVPSEVGAAAFGGPRVLVGIGATRSYAYDGSDWAQPVPAGSVDAGGLGERVTSRGSRVLLDFGRFGILDFENPGLPKLVSASVGGDSLGRTTWVGGVAWGIGSERIWRWDPADSNAAPESYPLEERWRRANLVAGDDGLLLLGTTSGEIQVFGVPPTGAPVPRGTISDFGEVSRVMVSGDSAYAADGNGTRLLDLSDPDRPRSAGLLRAEEPTTSRSDLDLRGSLLVTLEGEFLGPVSVWNLAPGSAPVLIRRISPRATATAEREPRLVRWVSEGSFFVAGRNRVTEYFRDATRGWIPGRSTPTSVGDLACLAFDGSTTLFIGGTAGLQAYPFNGGIPEAVLGLPAAARGVAAMGAHAYVACDRAGLVIVEATRPASPRVVGSAATLAPARGVTVRLPYVFVATGEGGVEVFEVVDAVNPRRVASFDTPGEARSIELRGDTLYVADGAAGVSVLEFRPDREPQSIVWPPLFDRDWKGPAFRIPVTSGSGLPVTLRVIGGPATVEGDLCRPSGQSGAVFLRAEQPGNEVYAPAVAEARFDFPFLNRDLISNWMLRFFPACPPGSATRSGDPDGDGFDNEAEHVLGTDPMVPDAERRLPIPGLESDPARTRRFVRLELTVRPDPVVAVDWTRVISFGTHLGATVRNPVPREWLDPQWDRVVIRIPVNDDSGIEGGETGFLRLEPF